MKSEEVVHPFAALGLSEPLLRAVDESGYAEPTAIQRATIPAILERRDVRASAETGSGKTAAFVLPLLQLLAGPGPSEGAPEPRARRRPVRALVLVPTRELALQIGEAIDRYGAYLPERLRTCVAIGGVSINPQMLALRGGADIVVATPGRLLDLVSVNALSLPFVETLVLDEADRMLSLGFADELHRVLALLEGPQILLFSATFPPAVDALATPLMNDPVRVSIEAGGGVERIPQVITQRAIAVDAASRTKLLRHLLGEHAWPRALVFVASRHAADHVADKLRRAGIAALSLHGELAQAKRAEALSGFRAERVRVLVATDVAARGLDVSSLPVVINYDLPRSTVDYVHRIGRTGRAGEIGMAVSFVTADGEAHFRLIEKRQRLAIERERIEGFEPQDVAAPVGDPHGGVKGKRKSKKDKLREAAARAAIAKKS